MNHFGFGFAVSLVSVTATLLLWHGSNSILCKWVSADWFHDTSFSEAVCRPDLSRSHCLSILLSKIEVKPFIFPISGLEIEWWVCFHHQTWLEVKLVILKWVSHNCLYFKSCFRVKERRGGWVRGLGLEYWSHRGQYREKERVTGRKL